MKHHCLYFSACRHAYPANAHRSCRRRRGCITRYRNFGKLAGYQDEIDEAKLSITKQEPKR